MLDLPTDQHTALNILLSIGRFGGLHETQKMREWLATERKRLDALNRRERDEVVFRQRQGALQVLEDMEKLIDQAGDKAEKIKVNLINSKGA